jgi:hypothetical protein
MLGLAQLVNDSLARHGVATELDPRRVQWSPWSRMQDSFSVLLAPSQPGLFALAEEVASFCGASESRGSHPERSEGSLAGGRRMLALFEISETEDLGMALGRCFLPRAPQGERLASGKCFMRFAIIEDERQRIAACAAFQKWFSSSAEAASGVTAGVPRPLILEASPASRSSNNQARNGPPGPFPSGF